MVRALGLGLVALALSGCWWQVGGTSGNTRASNGEDQLTRANVASLAEDWRVGIDGALSEPVVAGDIAYTAVRMFADGGPEVSTLAVTARNLATGEEVWQHSFRPPGAPVVGDIGSVSVLNGAVWVEYRHSGLPPCVSAVARLEPSTGVVLSTDQIGLTDNPIVADGGRWAYTSSTTTTGGCTGEIQLTVRDVASRVKLWSYTFPSPASRDVPVMSGGRIFVRVRGVLYAFDAAGCGADTCDPLWTVSPGSVSFLRPTVLGGPGGPLFIDQTEAVGGEFRKLIVALDPATGAELWRTAPRYVSDLPNGFRGLAVADGTLFASGQLPGDDDPSDPVGTLDAYAAAGCGAAVCEPTWSVPFGEVRVATEPSVAGGVVYVGLGSESASAPAVVAADAHGCGQTTCPELAHVPLVPDNGGAFLVGADPYRMSIASGHLLLAWSPNLYAPTQSVLLAYSGSDST
jgi:outer membrane protein assembly factor BamB